MIAELVVKLVSKYGRFARVQYWRECVKVEYGDYNVDQRFWVQASDTIFFDEEPDLRNLYTGNLWAEAWDYRRLYELLEDVEADDDDNATEPIIAIVEPDSPMPAGVM